MSIEEFLNLSKTHGIDNLQLIEFQDKSLCLSALNGKQKNFITTNDTSYEIKAKINKKYVKHKTNYLSEEVFTILKEKALNIESNYEDFLIEEDKKTKIESPKEVEKIESMRILNLYSLIRKYHYITDLEINYSVSNTSKRIVNLKGLDISTSKSLEEFYVQATAKIEGEAYTEDDTIYSTSRDINFEDVVENVLQNILLNKKKRKIEAGKYNVILSETFTSCLLGEFIKMLSKEEIRKKTSCLADKIDKCIFSPKLTIIEDPTNRNYPSYTKFDNEGISTYKKEIVKKGVLKTYLYNNKEAIIDNRKSTGNAYSGISAVNLYIEENSNSKDLFKELSNGLYITKYQQTGGITLNPTTGDISLQVYGQVIEEGKVVSTFEPSILTTTIFELFSNIKEIGSTKEFKTYKTASPKLLVENMSISSN